MLLFLCNLALPSPASISFSIIYVYCPESIMAYLFFAEFNTTILRLSWAISIKCFNFTFSCSYLPSQTSSWLTFSFSALISIDANKWQFSLARTTSVIKGAYIKLNSLWEVIQFLRLNFLTCKTGLKSVSKISQKMNIKGISLIMIKELLKLQRDATVSWLLPQQHGFNFRV